MSKLYPNKVVVVGKETTINDFETTYANELKRKLSGLTGASKPAIVSLFDSVHDFGKSSIVYDTLYKKATTLSLHSLSQYVLSKYAFDISNKDFLTLKSPAKSFFSIVPSNQVEDIFILDAINDATTGTPKGKVYTFTTSHDTFKDSNDNITQKNQVANKMYDIFKPYFTDTGIQHQEGRTTHQVIPCVIDTQNSFHKIAAHLRNKFAYLTIQEMISDSSKKIGIHSDTQYGDYFLVENINQQREYKVQDNDHYGFYNVKFFSLSSLGSGRSTNYYANAQFIPHTEFTSSRQTTYLTAKADIINNPESKIQILNSSGTAITNKTQFYYRIKMNQLNHLTSIPVVEHQFAEQIMNKKHERYINITGATNKNTYYEKIKQNEASITTKYNIMELFSRKRYGDQLMGSFCYKVNKGDFTGFKVHSIKTPTTEYTVKQALLITGDRMLFAYAVHKGVPCVLDMTNIAYCFVPTSTVRTRPAPARAPRPAPAPARAPTPTPARAPTPPPSPATIARIARQKADIAKLEAEQAKKALEEIDMDNLKTRKQKEVANTIIENARITRAEAEIAEREARRAEAVIQPLLAPSAPPAPLAPLAPQAPPAQKTRDERANKYAERRELELQRQQEEKERRQQLEINLSQQTQQTATNAQTAPEPATGYISGFISRVSSYFSSFFSSAQRGGSRSSIPILDKDNILIQNMKRHPHYLYDHLIPLFDFIYKISKNNTLKKIIIQRFDQITLFKNKMDNDTIRKIIITLKDNLYNLSNTDNFEVSSTLRQYGDDEDDEDDEANEDDGRQNINSNIHYKMMIEKREGEGEDIGYTPLIEQNEPHMNISELLEIINDDSFPDKIKTSLDNVDFQSLNVEYHSTNPERMIISFIIYNTNERGERKSKTIYIDLLLSKFIEELIKSGFDIFDEQATQDIINASDIITQNEECGAGAGAGAPPQEEAPNVRITRSMARRQEQRGGNNEVLTGVIQTRKLKPLHKPMSKTQKIKPSPKSSPKPSPKSSPKSKTLKLKFYPPTTRKTRKTSPKPLCKITISYKQSGTHNHLSLFNIMPYVIPVIEAIHSSKRDNAFKTYLKYLNLQLQQAYTELAVHYDIRSMSDPDMRELYYDEHAYHLHSPYYTAKPDWMRYKIFLYKLPADFPVFYLEHILNTMSQYTDNEDVIITANAVLSAIRWSRQYLLNTSIEYEELHDGMFSYEGLKKTFNNGKYKNEISMLINILRDTNTIYSSTIQLVERIDKEIPETYTKRNIVYSLYMGGQERRRYELERMSNKLIGIVDVE